MFFSFFEEGVGSGLAAGMEEGRRSCGGVFRKGKRGRGEGGREREEKS